MSSGHEVLAIGAHPDDVELNVGGTLLRARALGLEAAICHMTVGEMGTRGTPELRRGEARAAADALGVGDMRILGLPDGRVAMDDAAKDAVIRTLRDVRPRIVLAPYWEDLHPDHEATGQIVRKAAFLSGLEKWDTGQEPWRPERVLYYMSHTSISPHVIVDVTDVFEEKRRAAACYVSQFHDADSPERETFISGSGFWEWWEGRASWWGHFSGVRYGEAFTLDGPLTTSNPFALFEGFGKYKNG